MTPDEYNTLEWLRDKELGQQSDRSIEELEARLAAVVAAANLLRIDANRNLGGSYEADCRRSIVIMDSALRAAEVK